MYRSWDLLSVSKTRLWWSQDWSNRCLRPDSGSTFLFFFLQKEPNVIVRSPSVLILIYFFSFLRPMINDQSRKKRERMRTRMGVFLVCSLISTMRIERFHIQFFFFFWEGGFQISKSIQSNTKITWIYLQRLRRSSISRVNRITSWRTTRIVLLFLSFR